MISAVERALYGHLRFTLRRLDHEMLPDSIRELAHAAAGFFEMNDLVVVKRTSINDAMGLIQELVDTMPISAWPNPHQRSEIEATLYGLAEEIGPRRAGCDFADCPYHRLVNLTKEH